MIIGFVLMMAGFIVVRLFRKKIWWFKTHKSMCITGVIFTLAGFLAILLEFVDTGRTHFELPHAYIGLIIIVLSVTMPVLGFLQFKARKFAPAVKRLHLWLGRITLALMATNIVSGFYAAGII